MSAETGIKESYEPRFLQALDDDDRKALSSIGVFRTFAAGSALFHEHQVADRVLILRSGFVKLSCYSEDGREVVLAIRGPGDVLGEMAAIDGEPRSATAIALEQVEALALSTNAFNDLMNRQPRVSRILLHILAGRLRDADRRRVEFAAKETMGRVASRIVELSDRFGEAAEGDIRIDFPLTQEELAGWTACSRDSVVKALQSMRDLGWIETGRKRITVHDLAAVRRAAGRDG
jgi:CRP-like cAMP-binding protein